MRILVTGPREWTDENTLAGHLLAVASRVPATEGLTVVHGGADGFDTAANRIAIHYEWQREIYKPLYDRYPASVAPLYRNQEMVDDGADVCVAGIMPCTKPSCYRPKGHPSHGTADCIGRVLLAGIPLIPVRPGEVGASVPRGDSPDSPAPGKPGLSDPGDWHQAVAAAIGDPNGGWPVLPEGWLVAEAIDYPVVVFGAGGTAHVEPISEYRGKREARAPS